MCVPNKPINNALPHCHEVHDAPLPPETNTVLSFLRAVNGNLIFCDWHSMSILRPRT